VGMCECVQIHDCLITGSLILFV